MAHRILLSTYDTTSTIDRRCYHTWPSRLDIDHPMTSEGPSWTETHPEQMSEGPIFISHGSRAVSLVQDLPTINDSLTPRHNDASDPTSSWMGSSKWSLYQDPYELVDHLWHRPPTSSWTRSGEHRLGDHQDSRIPLVHHDSEEELRCHLGDKRLCRQPSGVSPLEPCLPTSASSRHAAAAVPIATTAGAAAAATTSSSSRLHNWCVAVVTAATSPTTSRGRREEQQTSPALPSAPTATPLPQQQQQQAADNIIINCII